MGVLDYIKIPKLTSFNKYLFIGPHPDDIEFGCGALISKLKEMNKEYYFFILTDGSAGVLDKNADPNILKNIRYEEAKESAKYLNAKDVFFGDLEDGGSYTLEDAIEKITKIICDVKPDCVFTVDPNVLTECHPDHIKCGLATRASLQLSTYPISAKRHNVDVSRIDTFPSNLTLVEYFTDKPNYFEKVKKKNVDEKINALYLHKSQTSTDDLKALVEYFRLKAKLDGFKSFKGLAESYQVLPPIFQHVYTHGIKPSLISLLLKK